MTKAQRRVLLISVAIAVAMLVFPPWETLGGHYLGHAPFNAPPGYSDPRPETQRWALPRPEPEARVSMGLLMAQLAALWIVGGGLILLLRRRDR